MAKRKDVALSAEQVAARLSVAVADLPPGEAWTSQRVRNLRSQRPEWLTIARRQFAAQQDAKAEQKRLARERWLAQQPRHSCFCCNAEFAFTIESGGLCDACNDRRLPGVGDSDWAQG